MGSAGSEDQLWELGWGLAEEEAVQGCWGPSGQAAAT